jgi:hypothetical protein
VEEATVPRHEIEFELPRNIVYNADVRFVVKSDDQRLGELGVSRGSVAWQPANHATAYHLDWEVFDSLMREHGHRR